MNDIRIRTAFKALQEMRYRKYNIEENFWEDSKKTEIRDLSQDEKALESASLQYLRNVIVGEINVEDNEDEDELNKEENKDEKIKESV